MISRIMLCCLLATPLAAQTTASFSLQPLRAFKAAFGSKVPGVAVYGVRVCSKSPGPVDLDSGLVYQAAETKFGTIQPALVDAIVQQARRENKWVKASRLVEIGSGLAAIFGVSGIVAMGKTALTAVASIPPVAHQLQSHFEGQAPPPAGAFSGAMLQGTLHIAPGGCESRLVLGEYVKGFRPFAVPVQ